MLNNVNLFTGGEPMLDSALLGKFRDMPDGEKISVLRQLMFSGIRPEDYVLASAIVLVPDRLEELAAVALQFSERPSPLPPIFSSSSQTPHTL